MNIVDIDGENLHIFWTTWEISMKVSGKMWLMIILKATKNQSFPLSLEHTFLDKPQGWGSNWSPSLLRVNRMKIKNLIRVGNVAKCFSFHRKYIFDEFLCSRAPSIFQYFDCKCLISLHLRGWQKLELIQIFYFFAYVYPWNFWTLEIRNHDTDFPVKVH